MSRDPPIKSGQCRIVKDNLPDNVKNALKAKNQGEFSKIEKRDDDPSHYYYYWMCEHPRDIKDFRTRYTAAKDLQYKARLMALQDKDQTRINGYQLTWNENECDERQTYK